MANEWCHAHTYRKRDTDEADDGFALGRLHPQSDRTGAQPRGPKSSFGKDCAVPQHPPCLRNVISWTLADYEISMPKLLGSPEKS